MDNGRKHLERRCPRLGGQVSFQYCQECGEGDLPCFKVIDCWWEFFDVVDFFQNMLSEDDFNRLLQLKPKPKLTSLLELIEQARNRCNKP
jgi:hypothetical protein